MSTTDFGTGTKTTFVKFNGMLVNVDDIDSLKIEMKYLEAKKGE